MIDHWYEIADKERPGFYYYAIGITVLLQEKEQVIYVNSILVGSNVDNTY